MKFVWTTLTLALSLVVALLAGACASNPLAPSVTSSSAATTIAAEVVPGVLKLQSLTRADATTVTISDPQQFTLEFLENNRIAVKADCNRASGGFTLNGTTLTIGPMAVTKAYCGSASLDGEFLSLLGGETVATVSATSLVLSSARGALRFSR
jgi:heat shock protein HslJ